MVMNTVILLVVMSLVVSCATAGKADLGPEATQAPALALDGSKWDLLTLEGTEITGSEPATLDFFDGQAGGISFCNHFSTPYTLEGTALTFGEMISTLMLCTGAGPEEEYVAALRAVANAAIEDGKLVLSNSDGDVLLVYAPAAEAPLEGVTWNLTGILENGGVASLILDTEITAEFTAGTIAGSAGCNRYTAQLTLEGAAVKIGPAASTRMFCAEPEGVMEQEQAYLAALEQVVGIEISRNTLHLLNAEGLALLTFTAAGE
jgi:heat shock protein HslJ